MEDEGYVVEDDEIIKIHDENPGNDSDEEVLVTDDEGDLGPQSEEKIVYDQENEMEEDEHPANPRGSTVKAPLFKEDEEEEEEENKKGIPEESEQPEIQVEYEGEEEEPVIEVEDDKGEQEEKEERESWVEVSGGEVTSKHSPQTITDVRVEVSTTTPQKQEPYSSRFQLRKNIKKDRPQDEMVESQQTQIEIKGDIAEDTNPTLVGEDMEKDEEIEKGEDMENDENQDEEENKIEYEE